MRTKEELIEAFRVFAMPSWDGWQILRSEAIHHLNQPEPFDVLKAMRNKADIVSDIGGGAVWTYSKAYDCYLLHSADLEQSRLQLSVNDLLYGNFSAYKEPEPELEDGQWYWVEREHIPTAPHKPSKLPMRYMGKYWWHGGAQITLDAIKPVLDENGNPKECK